MGSGSMNSMNSMSQMSSMDLRLEGPEGPEGPEGLDGLDGFDGFDELDELNANRPRRSRNGAHARVRHRGGERADAAARSPRANVVGLSGRSAPKARAQRHPPSAPRRFHSSARKNGAPISAVRMPSGISAGAASVRAARSAATASSAPKSAAPGITMR
ncbi:hypothetical protein DO70_1939 [Burkholderia pseudomallei]|nr:hypothetical protein DO70_1939 [Burkholderia pseudomallei]